MALCSSTYGRRVSTAAFAGGVIAACAIAAAGVSAQNGPIPGQSVNMVAGTEWPDGDPFLQRQNEGSMGVSTRNPLHILGGGNDYRTVDIPGLPDGSMSGDAWNGVFWSRDGGHRWKSTLLPGYPQDTSPEGLASPIHGLQAGADAVIRAGANGMMFYVGIAFNRDAITQNASAAFGGGKTGKVFISRFIDDNARETGNPFRYLETLVVDNGSEGRFLDKPWLAVDKPRAGAGMCTIPGDGDIGPQSFPSGNAYVAYTTFVGKSELNIRTKVMFARSSDCGRTWSTQKLSEGYPVNQGAVIAIEPNSGAVYVAWRRFRSDKGDPDGFLIAKSVDGGRTFTRAIDLVTFTPYQLTGTTTLVSRIFEQGTSIASFRTTGFPALAVDGNGVVYAAWAERSIGPIAASRIMMRRSADGLAWTETAFPVDNSAQPGHQMMPTLMFHAGRLSLSYYNLVEDHTLGFLDALADGTYEERREPAGDLADATPVLQRVFNDFVADFAPEGFGKLKRRHTIDLWLADAAAAPPFTAMTIETTRVSQYVYGSGPDPAIIQQFQYNPPNFPLFACQGALENCKAFFGDYIDIAGAPALVPNGTGGWDYNTNPSTARVLHAIWTDNRDVRPPSDGISWHLYTPPNSPFSGENPTSLFDPTKMRETCGFLLDGSQRAGMRNQNLYTARLTEGLVAGSPQNSKPLGLTTIDGNTVLLQRAFVVFVQNTTADIKTFRLTIANQPPDAPAPGKASFLQFASPPLPDPLTQLFVRVPAKSTATRTVFVTSTIENASVTVLVEEFSGLVEDGGVIIPPGDGGLTATVVLNPDITNPDITNPDITNPDITNPDITNAEVYNPDITNPDITNPDITNPDITNPDITNPDITNPDITNPDITNVQIFNPDITNPDITNPDITNPDITNPDITNPDITNPDITNGAVVEATWTVKDNGNTTGGYKVKLLVNGEVPDDFKTQLILHRGHSTPVAVNCELAVQRQSILVANIPNPEFESLLSPDITNPDITNPDITNATLYVGPGDDWAQITLRIVDTLPGVGPTPEEFLETTVTPVIVAQAVNTEDAVAGSTEPPVSLPPSRRVVFLVPPAGGEADEPIVPAVQVQVRDEFSRPVEGATVILSLGNGPVGAELGGNQAVTDGSGIAQFPALTVSPDGVYSLVASVGGEQPPAPAVSAPFIITDSCGLDDGLVAVHSVVDSPSSSDVIKSRIADFDGDPYPDLAVLHLNGTLTKMAGDGLGGFERRAQITLAPGTEGSPSDVAVADFNNDGLDDVVASFPTEDLLAIVLSDVNSPDTYFSADATTRAFGVNGGPTALAAGRFQQFNVPADEDVDLAVAATTDNTVWLLEGDNNGGFTNEGSFADLFGPVALAAGDMDGDAVDDLAVATRGNGDNIGPAASVLLSSLFYDDEVPSVPGGSAPAGLTPSGVTIADFNNDGHNDVAVVSAGLVIAGDDVNIAGDVRVLHGDSAGHVQPASLDAKTLVVLPGRPVSVAAADVNADGFPDLAIADLSNLVVSVRENTGGYAAPVAFVAGNTPVHVAAGDVNGDGPADVVVANREADDSGNSTVSMFLTRCGTSLADVSVAMGEVPPAVAPGDSVMYQTTVTNNGPSMATNVTLTQRFDGTLVRALSTAGECDAGPPVTCVIGDLAPGTSEIVSVEVTAPDAGPMTSRATVRATQTDLSPANNTATATTNVVVALAGGALSFDGVDDFVLVAHGASLSLQELTLEAWAMIEDPGVSRAVLVNKGANFGNYTLAVRGSDAITGNQVEYVHAVADGNYNCCTAEPAPVVYGEWIHLAITISGETARLYVNGQLVASDAGALPPVENETSLFLGRLLGENPAFMTGVLDEVRIWNVARAGEDIAASYNKTIDGPTPGLVAYWKFDEDGGGAVVDSSGSGNHGILGNGDTGIPTRVTSTAPIVP